MSQLTQILNLIESWVHSYNSDELRWVKMRPGLTIGQIEDFWRQNAINNRPFVGYLAQRNPTSSRSD
ncbi:MAG: hypothetical protein KME29_28030 [Calothrix sp. FI2-JRJ7]|jgi:hypothetical protein|nr:hypothetical protein [Calothrix sp. FI2-JRJ7]